ncbi:hypothetical protein T265_15620, partial [Opisthorchis viverrini]
VVFLRARNTIWFDSSEWDLPLARTLPWSGPDETECGTQCQFRVQLSVRVHGKHSLLQRQQTEQFKLHVAVDMDASIVNLVYKRLAGVSDMQNAGGNGFMSMGLLQSVVTITITRDTLMNTNRMATQILCELGDPLGYTGRNLRPFVFQLNTAGAFRELDEPINDQPATSPNASESNLEPSYKPQWSQSDDHLKRSKRATVSKDSVTITAEVICGNEDQDLRDNKATITYKLQLAAKIELSSSALDRTTIDTRNFTVQLYEMQRIHPETLGPEIKHIYLVSNDGPSPIENLWVNVSLPIQTSEGERLGYILDRVRYHAEDGGPPLIAATEPEATQILCELGNPLGFTGRNLRPFVFQLNTAGAFREFDEPVNDQPTTSPKASEASLEPSSKPYWSPSDDHLKRSKRATVLKVSVTITAEVICGNEDQDLRDNKVSITYKLQLAEKIEVFIRCRIDQLSRGDAVRIVIRGHVWADTFFRHKISDLAIVSEARSEMASVAFGISVHGNRTIEPLAISQNFVFQGIKVPLFRQIPLWPIILGCILGAALLAFIILGMWRCGFFRRRRWYDNAAGNSMSVVPTDL